MTLPIIAGDACGVDVWWTDMSTVVCFLLGAALFNKRVTQHPLLQSCWKRASEASSMLRPRTACDKADPDVGEAAEKLDAEELLGLVQRSALPLQEGVCLKLLASCAEGDLAGLESEVRSCARQLPLTPPLCSALVRAYIRAGLDAEAKSLYQEALAQEVDLDEEAEELYDAMLARDL